MDLQGLQLLNAEFCWWVAFAYLVFRLGRRLVLLEGSGRGLRESLWMGESIFGELAMAVLVGFFIPCSLEGLVVPFLLAATILTVLLVFVRKMATKAHTTLVKQTYLAGKNGNDLIQQIETLHMWFLGYKGKNLGAQERVGSDWFGSKRLYRKRGNRRQ